MNALTQCGFVYDVATRSKADGALIEALHARNRVPGEGLNLIASAIFAAGPVPGQLHIGLWTGAYVPNGTETAATLPALVTELTAYEGTTRKLFVPGAVADGGCSNAASLAIFNFSADAVVNGAFISTAPAKGATNGALLSVVRFPAARPVDASVYLEILSGFQFLSM
mgnify:FL=1